MQFGTIEFYALMLVALVIYASWKTREVQQKIYCTLRRADNSVVTGWASWAQHRIALRTGTKTYGWFEVDVTCVQDKIWNEGLPFFLFPTRGAWLDFSYTSSKPLNPKTFKNEYPSPNDRALLDKTNDLQALNEGGRRAMGSAKKTILEQYMPLIMVLGFLVVGYFIWDLKQGQTMLGAGQNAIQGLLGQLLKK